MAIARRTYKIAFAAGALVVALALAWWAFAVPALVKYPTDVDITPKYTGTMKLFVDPATATPLATPQEMVLNIQRHIDADAEASSASRVVVKETITQQAGPLNTTTQNVYVMDRRTLKNVGDDRAYAYDPANVVDRSGAYRLNLPMGTDADGKYTIYKNEIGGTYTMQPNTATPTTETEGLTLANFTGSAKDVPLSPAYLASLGKAIRLPETLTPTQLATILKTRGIDLPATLASIAPALAPADAAALNQLAAQPVKLQYVTSFDGRAGVDRRTGIQVDVSSTDTIAAKPVLGAASELQALLARYSTAPAVQAAMPVLQGLLNAPAIPVAEFSYNQTRASVAEVADEARSERNAIFVARAAVPYGLLAVGIVLLAIGIAAWIAGRPEGLSTRASWAKPRPA